MTATPDGPAQAPKRSRRETFVAWLRRSWVPLVLVTAAMAMCGTVTVQHHQQFSPYDEWVYYDYVMKIPTQGIVRQGEYVGSAALEAMACVGDGYGPRGQVCTGPNGHYKAPAHYPQEGKTTADAYTPLYFDVTWGLGTAIKFVTGLDFLTAARLSGFFWLAGGLIAFSALARELKFNKLLTVGLGLVLVGSVASKYAFTYISTDASAFVSGAVLLLFALRFIRGKTSGWWLVPLAVVAVLLKITNIFAVGLVAVFLLTFALLKWRQRSHWPPDRPSPLKIGVLTTTFILASLLAQGAWLVIRAAIAVGDGPNQGVDVPISIRGIAATVTTFIGLPGTRTVDGLLTLPLAILTIVGIFGFFLQAKGSGEKRALSIATVVSATLFGPLLLVVMGIVLGAAFPVVPRYSQSLVPAFFAAIAFTAHNKLSRYLVLGYGIALTVAAIGRAFYLH